MMGISVAHSPLHPSPAIQQTFCPVEGMPLLRQDAQICSAYIELRDNNSPVPC